MILVIDANPVISALLKEGKSREIIASDKFTLVAPEFLSEEIYKHKRYIAEKAGITENEIELLSTILLRHIQIIPESEYKAKLPEAVKIIKNDEEFVVEVL